MTNQNGLFGLPNKPIGTNNLIIEMNPREQIKNKNAIQILIESGNLLAEIDNRGIFLVRAESKDILQKKKITFRIIGVFPMPKSVKTNIRHHLVEKGVVPPF